MNSVNKTSRVLGSAFLLQALSALLSNVLLMQPLVVSGNIMNTMINISKHALKIRAYILGEMITSVGVIFLGAILFVALKKYSEKIALVAFGFYILEGALVAISRLLTFALLRISQDYVAEGSPVYLKTLGKLAQDSMDYGATLAMLAFCLGAILFYYLLTKSTIVPRALSLWGLIAVSPCLIGTLMQIFGYKAPIFLYVTYVPFEFFIGAWILVKGVKGSED